MVCDRFGTKGRRCAQDVWQGSETELLAGPAAAASLVADVGSAAGAAEVVFLTSSWGHWDGKIGARTLKIGCVSMFFDGSRRKKVTSRHASLDF